MKKFYSIIVALMIAVIANAGPVKVTSSLAPNRSAKAEMMKTLKQKRNPLAKAPRFAMPKTATNLTMDAAEAVDYGEIADGINLVEVILYNQAKEYPCVDFMIYVTNINDLSGTYSATLGNLDVENGYVMLSEEEGDYIDDGNITITKVGSEYKFQGSITGYFEPEQYTFNVQAPVEIAPAYTYDWEPDVTTTIDFTATKLSTEDAIEDGGVYYIILDCEEHELILEYNTEALTGGKIPAGTYNIDSTYGEGTFSASIGGDDNYDYGCFLATGFDEEGYYSMTYYLVSGTVTVSYAEDGAMTVVVNATSAKGSTIKATYVGKGAPAPGEGTEIVVADYAATNFEANGFSISTAANGGTTPAYNKNSFDLRTYAGNTLTVDAGALTMTQIDFYLSAKGIQRQAEITPSTGEMVYDMTNGIVYWMGEATTVTFTVGAGADYGSDGSGAAGQFDFTKMVITTGQGTTPTAKTLTGISVADYQKEFVQNTSFAFGGKVTASYDNGSTADVTGKATFTGYDMSKLGTQTVTVSYTENNVTETATYNITVVEEPVIPGGGIEIIVADYEDVKFNASGVAVSTAQNGGASAPVYNGGSFDLRTYAKNTLVVDAGTNVMTSIVFYISTQGLKRQAEITPSTGTMTYDMDNATVTWTGSATSVTFTVGDKAVHGTEPSKAGQFDFTKMVIRTAAYNGIADVNSASRKSAIYDLTGRKVAAPVSGQLYLINGKKVIMK